MELTDLRALVALGDQASLTRASVTLHLSPPAVFKRIRQLEEDVGQKLYERAGKVLTLTTQGRVLTDYARRILLEHDRALDAVKETAGLRDGHLRFGCGPHTSVCIAPYLLRAFHTVYPKVEVDNMTADPATLLQELGEGRLDILLVNPLDPSTEFEVVPLWRQERVIVVSPRDPLVGKKRVTPRELEERPFIIGSSLRDKTAVIRMLRAEAGFAPSIVMQHDQAGSIKELVRLGVGVSILPSWSVAEDVEAGTLRVLRLTDRTLIDDMGLLYRRGPHSCVAVTVFRDTVLRDWRKWLPGVVSKHLASAPVSDDFGILSGSKRRSSDRGTRV